VLHYFSDAVSAEAVFCVAHKFFEQVGRSWR
jgi:hypothetical protein